MSRKRKLKTRKLLPKILIFPEGDTERYYFDKSKSRTRGAGFTVKVVPEVIGKSGYELVKETISYLNRNKDKLRTGDEAYVVFDYDSQLINSSYRDEGIKRAYEEVKKFNDSPDNFIEIQTILSNDSFELWFKLHFGDVNRYTRREELYAMLSKDLGREYAKPEKNIYDILQKKGSEADAISRAKKLTEKFGGKNPSTEVYKLIERISRRENS